MERYYYYVWQYQNELGVATTYAIMANKGGFSLKRAIEFQEFLGHSQGFVLFWEEISSDDYNYLRKRDIKTLD